MCLSSANYTETGDIVQICGLISAVKTRVHCSKTDLVYLQGH